MTKNLRSNVLPDFAPGPAHPAWARSTGALEPGTKSQGTAAWPFEARISLQTRCSYFRVSRKPESAGARRGGEMGRPSLAPGVAPRIPHALHFKHDCTEPRLGVRLDPFPQTGPSPSLHSPGLVPCWRDGAPPAIKGPGRSQVASRPPPCTVQTNLVGREAGPSWGALGVRDMSVTRDGHGQHMAVTPCASKSLNPEAEGLGSSYSYPVTSLLAGHPGPEDLGWQAWEHVPFTQ